MGRDYSAESFAELSLEERGMGERGIMSLDLDMLSLMYLKHFSEGINDHKLPLLSIFLLKMCLCPKRQILYDFTSMRYLE